MDALSIQTGLSLQDIELQETSFLCVAPTKKYTPKHVLLMQNWKPGMQLNSTKPKAQLLEKGNSPCFRGESLRWVTSARAAPHVPVFDNKGAACGSCPPRLNHTAHLWAMQQHICWAALRWGTSKRTEQCPPTPLPRLAGEAEAASPPKCPARGKAVGGCGWRSTRALILSEKHLVCNHRQF